MPSRLSSLLVRDGLVGVKRMELAFQRQVIYGGCLDTILLEMNLLPEERLLQYLSLATGLPPATRAETEALDDTTVERCPSDLAKACRVVPLCFEDGALRVLVHDPVDLALLEDLANDIEVPVQPMVVPEYRFHLVFARIFGGTPNARFSELGRRAEESVPNPPVGRARTVIVESAAPGESDDPAADAPSDDSAAASPPRDPLFSSTAIMLTDAQDEVAPGPDAEPDPDPGTEPDVRPTAELATESAPGSEAEIEAELPSDLPDRTVDDLDDDDDTGEHVVVNVALPPSSRASRASRANRMTQVGAAPPPTPVVRQPRGGPPTEQTRSTAEKELGEAQTDPLPLVEGQATSSGSTRSTRPGVGEPQLPPAPASSSLLSGPPGSSDPGKQTTAPMGSRNPPRGADQIIHPSQESGRSAGPESSPGPSLDGSPESSESRRRGPANLAADVSSTPLAPVKARKALATAEDRDLIFGVLLRAVRYRVKYACLLTVQGGAAIGRVAITGEQVDREDIGSVLIPLDSESAFHTVISSGAPHIGPIATGDPEIDTMIARMGTVVPPSALLLPIVLRNRVVAIAVGHDFEAPIDVGAVSELLPLASLTAEAISRVIMKAKAERLAAAPEPQPSLDDETTQRREPRQSLDEETTQRREPIRDDRSRARPSRANDSRESARASIGDAGDEDAFDGQDTDPFVRARDQDDHLADSEPTPVLLEAEEPEPIKAVIDVVESGEGEARQHAEAEAVERSIETLDELYGRFPGKLDIDRYELGGRSLPADKHGPLLALIIRLGPIACDMLIEKMRDEDRDTRYYATISVAELHPRRAISALVERLFDRDYGIRTAAIRALAGYPDSELDQGLVRARQALHSDAEDRVQAAAQALASLGDIRSIPDLLTVLSRGEKSSEYARRALIQLTKQSFGTSARKWRSWWSKNKNAHRVQWLLEGLAHKDDNIRRSSAEDLRKLTGEYFDYQYDLPRREREQARQRWLDWWTQIGKKHFIRSDESKRSTAVLPGKQS